MTRLAQILCSSVLLLAPDSALAQPKTSPSELQTLVNDTARQLQLSYRHNLTESHARHEQVRRAIAAWKDAARSDVNNRLLAQWLRQTMRNSMPGSRQPLPAVPDFDRPMPAAAVTLPTETNPQKKPAAAESPSTADAQDGNPFRDDPPPDEQDDLPAPVDSVKK